MQAKKITLSTVFFALILTLMATNAFAIHEPGHTPMYDEETYTRNMNAEMEKLDKLFLQSIDKNQPQAEALKAKRESFKVARKLLQSLNERLDALDPMKGAALSHTEMLMMNHIQIMLLDMLTSIHMSEWASGDRIE